MPGRPGIIINENRAAAAAAVSVVSEHALIFYTTGRGGRSRRIVFIVRGAFYGPYVMMRTSERLG